MQLSIPLAVKRRYLLWIKGPQKTAFMKEMVIGQFGHSETDTRNIFIRAAL